LTVSETVALITDTLAGVFKGVGLHFRYANWFDNLPSTWNIDCLGFRLARTY